MPQRSDVIPRPDFDPPPPHAAGARAGLGTGLVAGTLATLGSASLGFGVSVLGVAVAVGALAGVFFDRVARSRDPAVFPVAFGVLGSLTGAATLALLPQPHHVYFAAPLLTAALALACGGLAGALVGASAGVFVGRRDPKNPLPAAARSALVAGLGAAGFVQAMVWLGIGIDTHGPLGTAILTLAGSLEAAGPVTLGLLSALAAAAGTLLAAGRQAWVEQDLPPAPVLSGNLLHDSSEGYRALLAGDDPTVRL